MIYINNFDTIEEALSVEDILSPNVTYIEEAAADGGTGIVYTNFGDNTPIVLKISSNGNIVGKKYVSDWTTLNIDSQPLTFVSQLAGSTISIKPDTTRTDYTPLINFEYSIDGIEWQTYTLGQTLTMSDEGDFISFRGDNSDGLMVTAGSYTYHTKFTMSGKIAACGNVMSLLDSTLVSKTVKNRSFHSLFYGCTALTTAPILPATTLASYCYAGMFLGCTSLTTAPELPATELAWYCYAGMFLGCTSLTTAPELPATTLANYCYKLMFKDCENLSIGPILPATVSASECYSYMFYGCKKITRIEMLLKEIDAYRCIYVMYNTSSSYNSITVTFIKSPDLNTSVFWTNIPWRFKVYNRIDENTIRMVCKTCHHQCDENEVCQNEYCPKYSGFVQQTCSTCGSNLDYDGNCSNEYCPLYPNFAQQTCSQCGSNLDYNGDCTDATCPLCPDYTLPYDPYEDRTLPPNDEIWYITYNGQPVTMSYGTGKTATDVFGVSLVSNTYTNGKGILKFSGNVTTIKSAGVSYWGSTFTNSNIMGLVLPQSCKTIKSYAIYRCAYLTTLNIGGVETIEEYAILIPEAYYYKKDTFRIIANSSLTTWTPSTYAMENVMDIASTEIYAPDKEIALICARGTVTDLALKVKVYVGDKFFSNCEAYCCFVEGTLILVSLDGATRNIEDMKIGDDVVSYDVSTGENYIAKVKNTIIKDNISLKATIQLEDGKTLTMNEYHPILTDTGFKSITEINGLAKLEVGDNVKTIDGYSAIVSIDIEAGESVTMFNLDVVDIDENPDDDANDNFYANGICAHNVAAMCDWNPTRDYVSPDDGYDMFDNDDPDDDPDEDDDEPDDDPDEDDSDEIDFTVMSTFTDMTGCKVYVTDDDINVEDYEFPVIRVYADDDNTYTENVEIYAEAVLSLEEGSVFDEFEGPATLHAYLGEEQDVLMYFVMDFNMDAAGCLFGTMEINLDNIGNVTSYDTLPSAIIAYENGGGTLVVQAATLSLKNNHLWLSIETSNMLEQGSPLCIIVFTGLEID